MSESENHLLPKEFLNRLEQILPEDKYSTVLKSFYDRRPICFRTNSAKDDGIQIISSLEQLGFQLRELSYLKKSYILEKGSFRDLQETKFYQDGYIYVQGASSIYVVDVLEPEKGKTVLDMAAAPGSKASLISTRISKDAVFRANDANRKRFFKMKSVMAYLGITNVNLTLERGEFIGRKEPETFDRILLDAPCSSEGRFSTLEPKTMRYWKPGKIKEMVHKQKALMGSALMALKPGGVLVYSTCTFAPEENEGIVHWALSKYKEAIEVLPLSCPFPQVMPGLLEWGKKSYDAELTKTLRILPSAENEAFFIAKILKKDTN